MAFTAARRLAMTLPLLALAACSLVRPEVQGSADMPAAFGTVPRSLLGCPNLEGLYAWPWAEGLPFGYRTATRRDKFGSFLEIPTFAEAHIWVSGPADSTHELWLRSRMINRRPNVRIRTFTHDWSYQIVERGDYACARGWVELPEKELTGDGVNEWFGGAGVRVSARLAQLEDGSLAVGQRVRVYGRRQALFPYLRWMVRAPDRHLWYWTRLARIGPTGWGLPPDDAGAPASRP